MTWVRLDDDFSNHPKLVKAGPLGLAMQVAALCYCNHYLTDGFIPTSAIPKLLNLDGIGMRMWANETFGGGEDATWTMIVEDLIDAGIWEQTEDGYLIHDYLEYQPSKAQVMSERAANAQRQETWRAKKSNAVTNNVTDSATNTAPVPVPVPVPVPNPKDLFGADAPHAPRTKPLAEHKAAVPKPSAVEKYRSIARTWPDKSTWDRIANEIGDDAEALTRWGEVVTAYIALGWNKRNVTGMLEWFARGELPHLGRSGNGHGASVVEQAIALSAKHDEERESRGNF